MEIAAILRQMIILFLLLLVGYAANKLGFMNADFNKKFSSFVINVSTPALILHSVMNAEHALSGKEVWLLLGLSALTFGIVIGISMLIPKVLRAAEPDRDMYRFMTIFSNSGFMGFPVAEAMLGPSAAFYVALFGIPNNLLVYSYGVRLASGGRAGRLDRKTLLSPCILASLLAMIIYLVNPTFPDVLVSTMGYLADITVPSAMLIIGSSLALIPLRSVLGEWRVYVMSLIKLILLPVLIWALLFPLPISPVIRQFIVLMWALPTATNCTMLAAQYDGNETLASKGVLISTLLSLVTIPLLMHFLPFQ